MNFRSESALTFLNPPPVMRRRQDGVTARCPYYVGQAILPADWLFSQSCRLKDGSGHDWPPHKKQHQKSSRRAKKQRFSNTGFSPRVAAIATIALCLLHTASAVGQTAPAKQLLSEQAFKNVTVLKGIPVDEFMDTMGFISASTNYNCTDCHVEPKVEGDWSVYAEETPRKATARRMILMVQAINKTNFGGARVVTCYTCHRNVQGAPKITPSLADQYGEPPTPDPNEVRDYAGKRPGRLPPIRSLTSISRRSEERRRQPPSPASSSRAHTRGMQNRRRLWTFMSRLPISAP